MARFLEIPVDCHRMNQVKLRWQLMFQMYYLSLNKTKSPNPRGTGHASMHLFINKMFWDIYIYILPETESFYLTG